MKNSWIDFLSGKNWILIKNEDEFNEFRKWLKYLKISSFLDNDANTWNHLLYLSRENKSPSDYLIFSYDYSRNLYYGYSKDVAIAINHQLPLEERIIRKFYRDNTLSIDEEKLLIAYNRFCYEEYDREYETLPDDRIIEIINCSYDSYQSFNKNSHVCYDIKKHTYLYYYDYTVVKTVYTNIKRATEDLNKYSFNNFYSKLSDYIEKYKLGLINH